MRADLNNGRQIPPLSRQPLQVLVLGVGGNVSQGILKALAASKIPCRVIGACIVLYRSGCTQLISLRLTCCWRSDFFGLAH